MSFRRNHGKLGPGEILLAPFAGDSFIMRS